MPIKAENKARYPKDWKFIRAAVLLRANHMCERCGAPNGATVMRFDAMPVVWALATLLAAELERNGLDLDAWRDPIKIVLTIAHLDHVPEHCEMSNLLALCQKCHLDHDRPHHQREAAKTRRARKGRDLAL